MFFICAEPKACGRPEQPPNSTMIAVGGFDVGATVEYGCDEGHLLVGPSTRSCMDTGFYNEFPPVCKCMCSDGFQMAGWPLVFSVTLSNGLSCLYARTY